MYTGLNTKAKPPWTISRQLKENKGQEGKIGLF
jgi:hypothetical protein